MNYKQSSQILNLIKQSENILINIHKNPDLDSFSSALSMAKFVKSLGKRVTVVTSQPVGWLPAFYQPAGKITVIDYSRFDPSTEFTPSVAEELRTSFSKYDLFIIVDSSSYDRVTGKKDIFLPKMPKIVIDHHQSNQFNEKINLIDTSVAATAEIIYRLFNDWKYPIDKQIATMLLAGIAGDTVFFKYLHQPKITLAVVLDLLKKGADQQKIVAEAYDSLDFFFVKMIGKFLERMVIAKTKSGKQFVWAAISYAEFIAFGKLRGSREAAADMFFRSIKDVDFGVAMLEAEKGKLEISFRSKITDVSILARSFGGGGHINAAGATVNGEFKKTVKKVINQIVTTT